MPTHTIEELMKQFAAQDIPEAPRLETERQPNVLLDALSRGIARFADVYTDTDLATKSLDRRAEQRARGVEVRNRNLLLEYQNKLTDSRLRLDLTKEKIDNEYKFQKFQEDQIKGAMDYFTTKLSVTKALGDIQQQTLETSMIPFKIEQEIEKTKGEKQKQKLDAIKVIRDIQKEKRKESIDDLIIQKLELESEKREAELPVDLRELQNKTRAYDVADQLIESGNPEDIKAGLSIYLQNKLPSAGGQKSQKQVIEDIKYSDPDLAPIYAIGGPEGDQEKLYVADRVKSLTSDYPDYYKDIDRKIRNAIGVSGVQVKEGQRVITPAAQKLAMEEAFNILLIPGEMNRLRKDNVLNDLYSELYEIASDRYGDVSQEEWETQFKEELLERIEKKKRVKETTKESRKKREPRVQKTRF